MLSGTHRDNTKRMRDYQVFYRLRGRNEVNSRVGPDAVILGAEQPPKLGLLFGDLVSEIKGYGAHSETYAFVDASPGGIRRKRTRGMIRGGTMSCRSLHPHELLARVRLCNCGPRHVADEAPRCGLRLPRKIKRCPEVVMTAVNEKEERREFISPFRTGGRRKLSCCSGFRPLLPPDPGKQNTRRLCAITRIGSRRASRTPQQLMERSLRAREDVERGPFQGWRTQRRFSSSKKVKNCVNCRQDRRRFRIAEDQLIA